MDNPTQKPKLNNAKLRLIKKFICMTLFAMSCAGCTNRLFGIYAGTTDLSTISKPGEIATITAGTWRNDCAIDYSAMRQADSRAPKPTKKLVVDPGQTDIIVVCQSPISTWQAKRSCSFTAIPGHTYRIVYRLDWSMYVLDSTSDTTVADCGDLDVLERDSDAKLS